MQGVLTLKISETSKSRALPALWNMDLNLWQRNVREVVIDTASTGPLAWVQAGTGRHQKTQSNRGRHWQAQARTPSFLNPQYRGSPEPYALVVPKISPLEHKAQPCLPSPPFRLGTSLLHRASTGKIHKTGAASPAPWDAGHLLSLKPPQEQWSIVGPHSLLSWG